MHSHASGAELETLHSCKKFILFLMKSSLVDSINAPDSGNLQFGHGFLNGS